MSILSEIFAHKHHEVAARKEKRSLVDVRAEAEKSPPALDFPAALQDARRLNGWPALIAEVKYASPSKGKLLEGMDSSALAYLYACHGATAISVLTDETYFHGSLAYLSQISDVKPRLPLLCKDFIFDPYQIFEARSNGADAVLLIAAMLEPEQLHDLQMVAGGLGMAALVEVHSEEELEKALGCSPQLIGINNRDLRTFSVCLDTTRRLRPLIPAGIAVITESGIHSKQDILQLEDQDIQVDGVLVGEALVTAVDIPAKVGELAGMGS